MRICSSVVIDVAPRLPRHPALEGKYLQPYYSPFRFPGRLDHVNTSKVSPSAFSRSTDISRYHFDVATLTPGSNDHGEMFGDVWRWLRKSGTYAVSDFVFSHWIDADALDLKSSVFVPRLPQHPGLHGKPIQPSDMLFRFPPQPDRVNASKVGVSDCFRLTNVYRYEFYSSALTAGSMDPTEAFGNICRWLRGVCASKSFRLLAFG